MRLFPFIKRKPFFTEEEGALIVQAVKAAEKQTSGEVRVFVESRCRFVDALDRAIEIFYGLEMDKTKLRNGVLVYVAMKDHQLAVFGDEGIHQKVGSEFWKKEISEMLKSFNKENYAEGIAGIVTDIGEALYTHFPYQDDDKNELPDEIIFGR